MLGPKLLLSLKSSKIEKDENIDKEKMHNTYFYSSNSSNNS